VDLVGRELLLRHRDPDARVEHVVRGHGGARDYGEFLRPAGDVQRGDQVNCPGSGGERRGEMAG
jgi:hypothetical protein